MALQYWSLHHKFSGLHPSPPRGGEGNAKFDGLEAISGQQGRDPHGLLIVPAPAVALRFFALRTAVDCPPTPAPGTYLLTKFVFTFRVNKSLRTPPALVVGIIIYIKK